MKIGFIGLGHMGAGMAANLIRDGHDVTVYNRTRAKLYALVALGASAAGTLADACSGEVVMTMLANDDAVESIVYGEGGVMAERLAADHAAAGQRFIAAPVFGRPDVAAAGDLFLIVAGDPAAIDEAAPLFEAIGQRTFIVSETPKTANLIKLSGNFLAASVIEALGEAMALIGRGGVDRRQYLDILTSTMFDVPVYRIYGGLIADRSFEPAGFAAPLGQKDIRLTLAAAEGLHVPLPFASLLRDRFLTLMAHGGDKLDWSAIGQLAARDAGEGAIQG